jgi:DNA-binding MarR family transcriptional regulator
MTEAKLDDIIHAPTRLQMVAMLSTSAWAEFGMVRDELHVSDSVLSKQVAILETAGYVKVKKGYVGKRPRTWLQLTKVGRAVFVSHVAALTALANHPGVATTAL